MLEYVDVELIAGEQKGGIEHLEPYGFTSHANEGAEALILFPDADRSHAVAVVVSDRRYRIRSLNLAKSLFMTTRGSQSH
jgi:phage gp45-like